MATAAVQTFADDFNERVAKKLKPLFIQHVLPSRLIDYLSCLDSIDEEVVLAQEKQRGQVSAAKVLFNRLVRRPNWLQDLCQALRNADVGLDFLADDFERIIHSSDELCFVGNRIGNEKETRVQETEDLVNRGLEQRLESVKEECNKTAQREKIRLDMKKMVPFVKGPQNVPRFLQTMYEVDIISLAEEEKSVGDLPCTFTFDDELKQLIETDKELAHLKEINVTDSSTLKEKLLSNDWKWTETYKTCLQLTDQDHLIELVDHFRRKHRNMRPFYRKYDWDDVLRARLKDGIVCLLRKRSIPYKDQLDEPCKIFDRKSPMMRYICKMICNHIKTSSTEITKLWPAYEVKNQQHLFFVVGNQLAVKPQSLPDYDVQICCKSSKETEHKIVLRHENSTNTKLDYEIMKRMRTAINSNLKYLRENHSNITMISASPFRSKGYSNDTKDNHVMTSEKCIVIFVQKKGLVPLQEEIFKRSVDGFGIDVREGYFQLQADGKPTEKHFKLKMGCAIGPSTEERYGTLGCFVDHPEHGLCAITCAHVVLNNKEMQTGSFDHTQRECVQPHQGQYGSETIGNVVDCILVSGTEGKNAGLDVALIKILKERAPQYGHFPDFNRTADDSISDFFPERIVEYCSDKVCSDLSECIQYDVAKCGATTSLTTGTFGFDGFAAFENVMIEYENLDICFQNQIQINDKVLNGETQMFSDLGDSGSLVFMIKDTGFVALGILLGRGDGFSVVTPICDILYAIGRGTPLSLKVLDSRNFTKIDITENASEEADIIASNKDNLIEKRQEISFDGDKRMFDSNDDISFSPSITCTPECWEDTEISFR